jgi:hypothetical protein
MKSIFKKIVCGCIVNADIHRGFSYAVIKDVIGCGFCTEEQREEAINHLWLTETEKYIWEDLIKCYGWSRENDKKTETIDITQHIEKMERGDQIDEIWNRHCGERIQRNLSSNDID